MDEDGDRDDIVDRDVTSHRQPDQFGSQSPRRPAPRTRFKGQPQRDRLAQAKRDRQQPERRREVPQRQRPAAHRDLPPSQYGIVAWPPGMNYWPGIGPTGPMARPAPVEPEPASKGPQPGQLGAYFEARTVRRWWAPWTKKRVWQQIST